MRQDGRSHHENEGQVLVGYNQLYSVVTSDKAVHHLVMTADNAIQYVSGLRSFRDVKDRPEPDVADTDRSSVTGAVNR